jgi:hypothetical protein
MSVFHSQAFQFIIVVVALFWFPVGFLVISFLSKKPKIDPKKFFG